MHWADVLAKKLAPKADHHVLATGITPSGPIHIGNMREVLTTDAVYRSLIKQGADAEFIYIADDYDHLRKVYPYLPKTYEQYVGQPISEIPCPCGEHDSYADHYLFAFLDSLEEIGVEPRVYRASEMYKTGVYRLAIETALEHTEDIKEIIERVSKRSLPKHWLPFNVKCEQCNRLTTTKPELYEYPFIEYSCECGYSGKCDIRKDGVGKLPWRVDWPARWKNLKVTFEPFGKDLGTTGGARETGEEIVEKIYDYPAPEFTMYEFILLKGKGAMHSSKGNALSANDMLQMTPPEVLRFLMMKNQPAKHITFDPGFGLLNLVDEYDQAERMYFGEEERIKGWKDLDAIYELSQPGSIPTSLPYQIPFRHLVTVVQIGESWEDIKNILYRTGQLPDTISAEDEKHLHKRKDHAEYWLNHFAPKAVRFTVQKKLPKIDFLDEEKKVLQEIASSADTISWTAENIHNLIYSIAENQSLSPKKAFTAVYKAILGEKRGPRAGFFLSNLDQCFVIKRFSEASS
jgi:lysyl-tRNA synthetase, class I